jgi:hypothetical protein
VGAQEFFQIGRGKTPQEAFDSAHDQAAYDYGHAGYTGTLAEKGGFTMITVPPGIPPKRYARLLVENALEDPLITPELKPKFREDFIEVDDKWGPAGCIKLNEGEYLFFGWASS